MKQADKDVVIIGGGQAGLAVGYYLKRAGCDFVILDAEECAGGAWLHGWDSLRLFSPAEYGSLPGWQMPPGAGGAFPSRDEVIDYLGRYERRYDLPVKRPVRVRTVVREDGALRVETDRGRWLARAVVSATGTWSRPFIPAFSGAEFFEGKRIDPTQISGSPALSPHSVRRHACRLHPLQPRPELFRSWPPSC